MENEINQEYDMRVNKGMLPTVDIAGHTFYVDIRMDKLRPKDDFLSKGIDLTEIKDYYDRDRRAYVIPYNPTTREFQQEDVFAMTELPKETIIVQFPHQYELDKVGWNRKHNIQSSKHDVTQMHFEARTLPWEDTNVIEHIKRNVAEQLQPKEEYIVKQPKDNLYRIPTDTERVLPTYKIHATEFIVDVNQLELREKNNPKNVISISDMDEQSIEGYKFWYSPISHSLTTFSEQGAKLAEIPDFVKLDPIGMAKKHSIPEDKIAEIFDFNLMVNQEVFDKIAHQGIKPTLDIAGHPFYIDLDKGTLRPKDDIWSRGIIFSELEYYYSHKEKAYIVPYNEKTHTFQEVSLNAKEIPENIIVVRIPHENTLDPICKNKRFDFNKSDYLKKAGVHLHYEAKVIPWHQTQFAETVKRNNEKEIKTEQKKSTSTKQEEGTVNKRKGRRM